MQITYDHIRDEMLYDVYDMSLTDKDEIKAVTDAVNQGIDSRLEACYVPDRGDKIRVGERKIGDKVVQSTLECRFSAESLPVLLRRMSESGDEAAESLVTDILTTIEIHVDTGCYEIVSPVDVEAPAN